MEGGEIIDMWAYIGVRDLLGGRDRGCRDEPEGEPWVRPGSGECMAVWTGVSRGYSFLQTVLLIIILPHRQIIPLILLIPYLEILKEQLTGDRSDTDVDSTAMSRSSTSMHSHHEMTTASQA